MSYAPSPTSTYSNPTDNPQHPNYQRPDETVFVWSTLVLFFVLGAVAFVASFYLPPQPQMQQTVTAPAGTDYVHSVPVRDGWGQPQILEVGPAVHDGDAVIYWINAQTHEVSLTPFENYDTGKLRYIGIGLMAIVVAVGGCVISEERRSARRRREAAAV